MRDKKWSEFTKKETIGDDADLLFLEGGNNHTIKLSDFLTSRTLSGELQQDGPTISTPILEIAGAQNKIRNLVAGSGIATSVEAENGAKIEHNFQTGSVAGVQVFQDPFGLSPLFRSLVPGSGILIADTGVGGIQVSLDTGPPVSSKTVLVASLSDLPSPVGGLITLADDTQYFFTQDLSLSDRLALGNDTVLSSPDTVLITLTYTGTGTFITSTNNTAVVKEMSISCSNGTLLNVSVAAGDIFNMARVRVLDVDTIGTISGTGGIVTFLSTVFPSITTNGFLLSGTFLAFNYNLSLAVLNAGTLFDLGSAVFVDVILNSIFGVFAASTTFLSGLIDSGNIASGSIASVQNMRLSGAGFTTTSGITPDDERWEFRQNNLIKDTRRSALVSLTANVAVTTIPDLITPVKVAGTWVVERASGYSGDTTGRITYIVTKPLDGTISATISAQMVSGSTGNYRFFVARNGTKIINSGVGITLQSGAPLGLTLVWEEELVETDFIEIFVQGIDSTVNIIVNDAKSRAS